MDRVENCRYRRVHKAVLIEPRIKPNHTTHTHTSSSSSMDPVEKWLESQLQVAESEMSHTAIEYLTYVAAELYLAGIITDRKYPPRFYSRLFAVLMRMLLDINDYYEEGDSFRFGKECLVRLAKHLGGVIIFPVAYDQFSEYLAAPDTEWRKHHAALVALAQISGGCSKVMIRNSQQLVTMVLNSFRHPHPRVRSAALTAIVRLSHDLNLQPRYYTRMLPALASAMDDFEYPKLQAHAASAVINFIKNYSTPDILTPYRDEIVSQLSVLLQSSNTWVQEAALTALASVADNSSQEQFQKYYDEVMPYLKAILVSKNEKASRMLRVYAKRCIDHFAVGKDKFRDDPKQVLLYANCISEEEYHASKAPLLQRLTAQGAKIDPKDIVIAGPQKKDTNNEWSVIDLQDSGSKNKPKQQKSGIKQVKGVTSVLGISSSSSIKNGKENSVGMSQENPFWNCELKEKENEKPTILMAESVVNEDSAKKAKKSPFSGFMKWKKSDDSEKDTVPLPLNDSVKGTYAHPKEGTNTKIKRKLHMDGSSSDFFVDKVLGDKIRKELVKSKSELQLSDDQIEVISTRLPIDKADLIKFFARKWCDQYGETVLEVVRKEYKDRVNEIKNMSIAIKKEQKKPVEEKWTTFDDVNMSSSLKKQKKTVEQIWTTFDDNDENCHPNLFADRAPVSSGFVSQKDDRSVRASKNRSSTDRLFKNKANI